MEAFLPPTELVFCSILFCSGESGLSSRLAVSKTSGLGPVSFFSLTQGAKGHDGAQGPPGAAGNHVSPILPDFWGLPRRGGPDEHLFSWLTILNQLGCG